MKRTAIIFCGIVFATFAFAGTAMADNAGSKVADKQIKSMIEDMESDIEFKAGLGVGQMEDTKGNTVTSAFLLDFSGVFGDKSPRKLVVEADADVYLSKYWLFAVDMGILIDAKRTIDAVGWDDWQRVEEQAHSLGVSALVSEYGTMTSRQLFLGIGPTYLFKWQFANSDRQYHDVNVSVGLRAGGLAERFLTEGALGLVLKAGYTAPLGDGWSMGNDYNLDIIFDLDGDGRPAKRLNASTSYHMEYAPKRSDYKLVFGPEVFSVLGYQKMPSSLGIMLVAGFRQ